MLMKQIVLHMHKIQQSDHLSLQQLSLNNTTCKSITFANMKAINTLIMKSCKLIIHFKLYQLMMQFHIIKFENFAFHAI